MAKRSYPRIGRTQKLRRRKCAFCDHQGVWEVHVQTTFTRGDDVVFYLCHEHEGQQSDPEALMASLTGPAAP